MPGMKAIRNGELFAFVPVTRGEVEFRPAGCTLYLLLPTPGTKGCAATHPVPVTGDRAMRADSLSLAMVVVAGLDARIRYSQQVAAAESKSSYDRG